MLYDTIVRFDLFPAVRPEAASKIVELLKHLTPDAEPARFELLPDKKLYAMVQCYETHPLIAEKLENHREYADIQLLLKGREVIGYQDVEGREVTRPYNPEKDVAMFLADPETVVNLPLRPGVFSLFFPGEGHLPGVGDGSSVTKLVIKIHRSLLK